MYCSIGKCGYHFFHDALSYSLVEVTMHVFLSETTDES